MGDAPKTVKKEETDFDEQKPVSKSESQEADTVVLGRDEDDASLNNYNSAFERTFSHR